jgi:hypothetical protein
MITTDPAEGEPQIRSTFFAANVRSYLGSGARVNASISETLRNERERTQFALRSNGIAITARDLEVLPNRQVRLKFAQIVNGCQTSHTLFNHRELLLGPAGEQVFVPVKIIVTDDPKVLNAAILSLNRQTPIGEEQVVTERDFVDRLRSVFADPTRPAGNRAYFEGRANEYSGRKDLDRAQIISIYELARAYAAIFLPNPEQINVQGKVPVIDQISRGVIFNKAQTVEPYYLAGVMMLRAREALARLPNQRKWDRYGAKNQLLFAMRLIAARHAGLGEPPLDTAGPEFATYVSRLEAVALDPQKARAIADMAVKCVREAVGGSANLNFKQAGRAEMTANVRRRVAALSIP